MAKKDQALREIDRPFYRYWQALYHSFFNNRLYVDVGKRWKGFGLGYFLLLICVVTLPFALRLAFDTNRMFKEDMILPLQQLPTIYIQNGQVSLDKPMPYLIKNKANQVILIVDTTGTVNSINNAYPYLNILITKDKIFFRFPSPRFFFSSNNDVQKIPSPIYVTPFSKDSNTVFEGKEWVKQSGLSRLKYFFMFLIYPTMVLLFFALFLVIFLSFALLGQVLAALLRFSISYKQACRLMFVSATPFMIFLWILLALGWFSNRFGFVLPLILIFYFCYAVFSLKRESGKLVVS